MLLALTNKIEMTLPNEKSSNKCCETAEPGIEQFFFSSKLSCFLSPEFDHQFLLCVPGIGPKNVGRFENEGVWSLADLENLLDGRRSEEKIGILQKRFGMRTNHARLAVFALLERQKLRMKRSE